MSELDTYGSVGGLVGKPAILPGRIIREVIHGQLQEHVTLLHETN